MGSTCHVVLGEEPRDVLSAPTFSKSFISDNRMPGLSRRATVVSSVIFHTILISAVLLVPLWYTNTMDLRNFTRTLLVAPPPPLAPPAPAVPAQAVARQSVTRRVFVVQGKLLAPRSIPHQIAMISQAPLPPAAAPPPPTPQPRTVEQPKQPLRVGGDVRPPHLLHQVEPVYPPLAKQARIQGDVVLSAVIDAKGNIVDLKVVSGHPLLYQAAINAVGQWTFEPTYLNGEPWPVSHEITVHFRL
jgi:protein TonB